MKTTKDVLFKLNYFPKSWLPDELSDCNSTAVSFQHCGHHVNVKEFWKKNCDYRSIITCFCVKSKFDHNESLQYHKASDFISAKEDEKECWWIPSDSWICNQKEYEPYNNPIISFYTAVKCETEAVKFLKTLAVIKQRLLKWTSVFDSGSYYWFNSAMSNLKWPMTADANF